MSHKKKMGGGGKAGKKKARAASSNLYLKCEEGRGWGREILINSCLIGLGKRF